MKNMPQQALYKRFAKYYHLLHPPKDYQEEVRRLTALIKQHLRSDGKDLLDVACGTGDHLSYFKKAFLCTGIDINASMISVARKKVKGVTFRKGDMTNFSLSKKFNVITCLGASINYVKTRANLQRTVNNFARHLKPGGVLIIEPYWPKSKLKKERIHMNCYDRKNIKVFRITMAKIKDNILTREKYTVIAEKGKDVRQFSDKRTSGLFEKDEMLNTMKKAGFKVKFLAKGFEEGWGLYIGIKKERD